MPTDETPSQLSRHRAGGNSAPQLLYIVTASSKSSVSRCLASKVLLPPLDAARKHGFGLAPSSYRLHHNRTLQHVIRGAVCSFYYKDSNIQCLIDCSRLCWNPLYVKGSCFNQGMFLFWRLTVNACGGVVLDTQVNVLIDTKTKVACVTEVAPEQLILLHLQTALLKKSRQLHSSLIQYWDNMKSFLNLYRQSLVLQGQPLPLHAVAAILSLELTTRCARSNTGLAKCIDC